MPGLNCTDSPPSTCQKTLLPNVPRKPKRQPPRRKMRQWLVGKPKLDRKAPLNPTVTSTSNSDFSSEDGSSDVSDLDKFEEAYKEFGGLTAGVDEVDFDRIVAGNMNGDVPGLVLEGGLDTLQTLGNVPKAWPLARLTIPLSGFSKQLEWLVEGYCMEVMATNAQPDQHLLAIKTFAKDLAERISSCTPPVLAHSYLQRTAQYCFP